MNGQTWLICGGRHFADHAMFRNAMSDLIRSFGIPSRVIHGDAKGADAMADAWARTLAVDIVRYPAKWSQYGKLAGPIRNQDMINFGKPDLVIIFPGGRGTADMKSRAEKANVKVAQIQTLSQEAPKARDT